MAKFEHKCNHLPVTRIKVVHHLQRPFKSKRFIGVIIYSNLLLLKGLCKSGRGLN